MLKEYTINICSSKVDVYMAIWEELCQNNLNFLWTGKYLQFLGSSEILEQMLMKSQA